MTASPRSARRWPWLLATAVLVACSGYAFRDDLARYVRERQAPSEAAAPAPAAQPIAITVAPVVRRDIAQSLVVTGTLVARDEVLVGAQVDGLRLDEFLVDIGDRVEKGQVLARLDRDMVATQLIQNDSSIARAEAAIAQVAASIAEAEASEIEAQAAFKRAETLKRSGNVTEETLQARDTAARVATARVGAQRQNLKVAGAEKALAMAQRREIELRLARTDVKAPAAGVIASRTARVGQIVGMAGEPLFRIVRDGEVELDAEVTERTLHTVEVGQPVMVEAAGRTEKALGRVRLVAPTVDGATRLGKVKVQLPPDPALRPGLFARGVIETARHDGMVAPRSAILFGADGPRVQVVVGDVVQTREVTLGIADADGVEVLDGLEAGEEVVARAGGFLRDGDRITAVRPPPAESKAALMDGEAR
jgi:HlyD family secretion protein